MIRKKLGITKGISFAPATMEFVIYDIEASEVNHENATEYWEGKYGRRYIDPQVGGEAHGS